jgi:hypothetical protein
MEQKIHVSKWVGDFITVGLFGAFFASVAMALALAFLQVGKNGEYAAEYTGIVNNVIVYLLGVFSGVIGVLFGIKNSEMTANIKASADVSKEIGAEKFVQMEIDKMEASANTDQVI